MVDYKNYKVWQRLHKFVPAIYDITSKFPKNEKFNLTSQLNRAAISIPTNIAGVVVEKRKKNLWDFYKFLQVQRMNWGI